MARVVLLLEVQQMLAWGRRYYTKNKGYHTGVRYDHGKASFVVSYGNRGKISKYQKTVDGVKDARFFTLGAAYRFTEKLSASLGYFHSWNRNTFNTYSIGADYKWLSGIKPYAEFTYIYLRQKYNYDYQKPGSTTKGTPRKCPLATYKGGVIIVGTKFAL